MIRMFCFSILILWVLATLRLLLRLLQGLM